MQKITEGSEQIAADMHSYITSKIIERMVARLSRGEDYLLTATDKWQIETLQDAGSLLEDIQKELAKATGKQEQEIKEAMEEAGVTALSYDDKLYQAAGLSPVSLTQSPYMIRLMQRSYEATKGEWKNFTRTMANEAQKLYLREMDKAYQLVTTGSVSYTQAVREAVDAVSRDGVSITYPSGHRDTIETATARAVRTGVAQATGDIQLARMEEMDWDIILVSSHLGARIGDGGHNPGNHSWWQGKFYSRTGRDKRFPPFSVTGYGTGEGLGGWNCRHHFGSGDGENNPFEQYDGEENKERYELEQRQRTKERRIRHTKRQVQDLQTAIDNCQDENLKSQLKQDLEKKSALLQKQNKDYREFSKSNNLKLQSERLRIAKWDRQQAARARGDARKWENNQNTIQQGGKQKTNLQETYHKNSEYKTKQAGTDTFDLEKANADYKDFLQSAPEKNRMYLEQSVDTVEYLEHKLKYSAFGYSAKADAIVYDTSHPQFWDLDYTVTATHELSHRIDSMFVRSWENAKFVTAVQKAKQNIIGQEERLKRYCWKNDEDGFLSDIIGAVSEAEIELPFKHSKEYWVIPGNKEKEIFANLFSLEAFNDLKKRRLLEEDFPELIKAYQNLEFEF